MKGSTLALVLGAVGAAGLAAWYFTRRRPGGLAASNVTIRASGSPLVAGLNALGSMGSAAIGRWGSSGVDKGTPTGYTGGNSR